MTGATTAVKHFPEPVSHRDLAQDPLNHTVARSAAAQAVRTFNYQGRLLLIFVDMTS
jgi:hypothetical protein